MKYSWKKGAALFAAALVAAGALCACAPQENASSLEEEHVSSPYDLENDGSDTTLVVAELFVNQERTRALQEIAEKYQADFPQTQIRIVTVESGEEAQKLLEEGGADLVEISNQEQVDCVNQGLLVELTPYLENWEELSHLTEPAKHTVSSLGKDRAYLLPATLDQDLLYYRSDWFEEYNEGKDTGLAYCRVWEDLPETAEKLQDKGAAGLVFGGKDHLVDLFDSMVWSGVNLGRLEDPAAGYFSAVEDHDTVFTLEQAATAAEQLATLVESCVPEEALTWTEEEAVEAFTQGKAIMLLAGQDQMEKIASSMEEGTWDAAAYPRGIAGVAITGLDFTGFGVAASSENVGNAVHFLTYLSNGDNNTHLSKVSGTVPIHTTAADMELSLAESSLAVNLLMVRRVDWYFYAQEPVMYQAHEGYRDWANDLLREYLAGQTGQQELLDQLDEYWSQARSQEGELWDGETE